MTAKPPLNPKRPRKSLAKRLLFWFGIFMLLLASVLGGAGLGAWFWITQDLPRIERLADYRPPAVTQIFSADGRLMAQYSHQRRYVTPMSEIPRKVVLAFVAAEDGNFFKHPGVDIKGVLRALIANIKAGRVVMGGSTITQQVARGLLLSPKKTLVRKMKEAVLAYRMESYLSKEEILYLYLNQIYLGHGSYGVEAAARTYFGKHASQLDLAEGALIAGLIQAPNRYSPLRHPRRARTRQVYVIGRMLEEGFITPREAQAALARQMDIRLHRTPTIKAPYYTEYVRQWLEKRFGATALYEGGLTVITACDPRLTAEARAAIAQGLAQLTRRQGFRGPTAVVGKAQAETIGKRALSPSGLKAGDVVEAVVTRAQGLGRAVLRIGGVRGVLGPEELKWASRWSRGAPPLKVGDVVRVRLVGYDAQTKNWAMKLAPEPRAQAALLCMDTGSGRVRVMIGGRDFHQSQFNRAIQARRQPGSAFKPFIYAAALDHPVLAYTPASVIIDSPVVFNDPSRPGAKWKPKNYENRFFGPTTLRTAVEHSRNVVTVKLLSRLGLNYTINYARRFGLAGPLAHNLSLALGASGLSLLEMTRAYSVFANQGKLVEPVLVEKVLDAEGKTLYEAQPETRQAISPQTAYLMTHLLRGVVLHGTGRGMLALNRPVAGKTGTTNDLRDAWFIGYTPGLVCGVWVGQDDNKPLGRRETGARAAGPIWLRFMQKALADKPARDFQAPPGVVFIRINPDDGKPVPPGREGGFFEAFKAGTEPLPAGRDDQPPAQAGASDFLQAETFAPRTPGSND